MAEADQLIVQVGDENYGPLTLDQLAKLIISGDVFASDYIFVESQNRWVMVCELENFSNLIPQEPRFQIEKPYIYSYEFGQQKGPFTKSQLISRIQGGRLTPYDYICFEGAEEWKRIRNFESFLRYFPLPPKGKPKGDVRSHIDLEGRGDKLHEAGSVSKESDAKDPSKDNRVEKLMDQFDLFEVSDEPVWMLREKGKEFGPYTHEQLIRLYQMKKATEHAEVKKIDQPKWQTLADLGVMTTEVVKKKVEIDGVMVEKTFIRRKHTRIPFFNMAQIEGSGTTESGNVINLSLGGCFVESPIAWKLKVGDEIKLIIHPGVFKNTITIIGEVTALVAEKPPGFGIKFSNIPDADRNQIKEYIDRVVGNVNT